MPFIAPCVDAIGTVFWDRPLERFGDRCLLILDGLDEHGLGKNQAVLKIIENEILLDCGIVVSSRPHSINEVQNHFSTIVIVD